MPAFPWPCFSNTRFIPVVLTPLSRAWVGIWRRTTYQETNKYYTHTDECSSWISRQNRGGGKRPNGASAETARRNISEAIVLHFVCAPLGTVKAGSEMHPRGNAINRMLSGVPCSPHGRVPATQWPCPPPPPHDGQCNSMFALNNSVPGPWLAGACENATEYGGVAPLTGGEGLILKNKK